MIGIGGSEWNSRKASAVRLSVEGGACILSGASVESHEYRPECNDGEPLTAVNKQPESNRMLCYCTDEAPCQGHRTGHVSNHHTELEYSICGLTIASYSKTKVLLSITRSHGSARVL